MNTSSIRRIGIVCWLYVFRLIRLTLWSTYCLQFCLASAINLGYYRSKAHPLTLYHSHTSVHRVQHSLRDQSSPLAVQLTVYPPCLLGIWSAGDWMVSDCSVSSGRHFWPYHGGWVWSFRLQICVAPRRRHGSESMRDHGINTMKDQVHPLGCASTIYVLRTQSATKSIIVFFIVLQCLVYCIVSIL